MESLPLLKLSIYFEMALKHYKRDLLFKTVIMKYIGVKDLDII